jgi:hypothetical protein
MAANRPMFQGYDLTHCHSSCPDESGEIQLR